MRKLVLLSAALLSACAGGPAARTPIAQTVAQGPFVAAPADADASRTPPDAWWRLYEDPVLDRLIAEAFAANTDLRVAAANLERARAIVTEARAAWLPTTDLSGGATYGKDQPGLPGLRREQWTYTGDFTVAWEADLFGRVRSGVKAAKADAGAAEAERDAVRVAVAAQTARAYSDACAFGESVAIARSSVGIAEESLRIVTAQAEAGSAAQLDVERAAAQLARARAAVAPLEDQRRASLFELAALRGRAPSDVPPEVAACARVPAAPASLPIGDGAALLKRRPDVREAERRLAAETARVGVATADLYPTITLGGSADYLRNDIVRGSDAFSYAVGPLISWRFPNITVARAQVRQARASADAALAGFDGTVLTALKEAEQALSAYDAEAQRRRDLVEAADRADKAFRLADARYRAGSLAYLDVLVAQQDLLNARSDLANSSQRLAAARVNVFRALGGGWATTSA